MKTNFDQAFLPRIYAEQRRYRNSMQYDERFWKTRLWLEILGGQKDELVKNQRNPSSKKQERQAILRRTTVRRLVLG
jgi:hypothetical protein